MTFTRNIPLATQTLSVSQTYLLDNTNLSDTIFGTDHYAFSASSNNGLHNTVTQPAYQNPIGTPSTVPPVTVASPIIYSLNPNLAGNIPVIQFSRGISNAVPSPLTTLQSISTPITLAAAAKTDVLDCTGLSLLYGVLYSFNLESPTQAAYVNSALVMWTGSTFGIQPFLSGQVLGAFATGNILQVINASLSPMTNIYWTFQLLRVS